MNMAATIREARQAAGLTQAELAGRAGMTQSVVARIERSRVNPTITTVDRLLRATGHTLAVVAAAAPAGVDEGQIRERLALSPAGRLQDFTRSQRRLAELTSKARRVPR
jgi:transcriptional regulator with XRE-family HTH domain